MYLQQCVTLGIYRLFKTAHMHMKKTDFHVEMNPID